MKIRNSKTSRFRGLLISTLGLALSACSTQPQTGLQSIFETEARASASSDNVDIGDKNAANDGGLSVTEAQLTPLVAGYEVPTQSSAHVLDPVMTRKSPCLSKMCP